MLLQLDKKSENLIIPGQGRVLMAYTACKLTVAGVRSLAMVVFPSKHLEEDTLTTDLYWNPAGSRRV